MLRRRRPPGGLQRDADRGAGQKAFKQQVAVRAYDDRHPLADRAEQRRVGIEDRRPGESQTLTATYRTNDFRGRAPVVSVYGWNAPTLTVAAG